MKKTLTLLVIAFAVSFVTHARITYDLSVKGALAKIKLKVVDQDGVVVPGAKIWGGFSANFSKDSVLVDGVTDINGEFVAQGKCNEFLRVDVTKDGYYHTEKKVNFRKSKADPIVVDGKWQPYAAENVVVMKRIKNPWNVKVFSEGVCRHRIPIFGEWIGFDFEQGDWLPPYGGGKYDDILVRFKSSVRKPKFDFTYTMEVTFTNNPYAGFYQKKKDQSSDLKSDYCATSNSVFKTDLVYVQEKLEDKPRRWDFLDKDSYIVFRTRTRVDGKGKLIGAHYGKIYGYWCSDDEEMTFGDGCFNPVENDPNIEGDQTLLYAIKNYMNGK